MPKVFGSELALPTIWPNKLWKNTGLSYNTGCIAKSKYAAVWSKFSLILRSWYIPPDGYIENVFE